MRAIFTLILTYITATVFAQPVISSFSPQSGPVGTSVTITGSGFNTTPTNNIVFFGAVKGIVNSATATSLNVTVPAGASYQPISVTVSSLTGYSSKPFITTFTPVGTGFSPTSFETKKDFSTHQDPYNIIHADFDGDGKADVAVPNSTNNSLSVLRNTSTPGTISFDATQYFQSNADFNVCAADFNGDGLPDIAACGGSGSDIRVLRNTSIVGSISFAPEITLPDGSWTNSITAADIDADGRPDLIIANQFGSNVLVLKNTTIGSNISFASAVAFAAGSMPNVAVTGDMDGDGKPDIIVTSGSTVSILKNTSGAGGISFAAKVDFAVSGGAWGLSVGDLDGDGKNDVAVTYSTTGLVSVLRNTSSASGISAIKTDHTVTNNGYCVAIGDMDGDGKADIAAGRTNILKNISTIGAISFSGAVNYATITGTGIGGLAVSDLDGDGRADVSFAGSGGTGFAVLRNRIGAPGITSFSPNGAAPGQTVTLTGTFFNNATAVSFAGVPASSFNIVNATTITAVVPGIVSGNITVTNPAGTGSSTLFYNGPVINSFTPTSGAVGTSVTITGINFNTTAANNTVYFGAVKATVTNVTSTSLTATVPAGATNQPISITSDNLTAYTNQPFNITFAGGGTDFVEQSFYPKVDTTVGTEPEDVITGDLDNDGRPEIISINKSSSTFSVLRNTSAIEVPSFAAQQTFSTTSTPLKVAVGDINGDGKLDVITTTPYFISIFRNTTTGSTISFAPRIDISYIGFTGAVALGDIDKDARLDIVAGGGNTNLWVFRNTTGAAGISFATPTSYLLEGSATGIALADLNADGKLDIVATNYNSYSLSVLRNTTVNGVITFASRVNANLNNYGYGVSINDLNEDGKPDIVVAANEWISVIRNTSTSVNSITLATRVDYTSSWQNIKSVVASDMDGDGKPDIVFNCMNNFYIGILRNISAASAAFTATSFSSRVDYIAGSPGTSVVAGDFDGDGRADIISANNTANSVSLLRNVVGKFPTLTSFMPTTAGIGATINLTGTNFINVSSVNFGGAPATFTVNSPTSITAVTGVGATGSVNVTTPNGTASLAGFISTAPPVVNSFSPASGNSHWTYVIIEGYNFSNATGVSFGGVPADTFIIATPNMISALVGAGGASGDVSVTSPNGTGSKAGFTYMPVPTITSFTPETGAIGSTVTITGNNYNLAASDNIVFFGAVKATVLSATSTTLTVKVPVGASYYPISITTSNNLTGYSKKPFIATFAGSDAFSNASFDPKSNWNSSSQNYDVAVSDIDGDGKPDLIILCDAISIYRNTSTAGTLSFATRVDLTGPVRTSGARIHVADLDGDGKPDISMTKGASNQGIIVVRNTSTPGSISFAARQSFEVGTLPNAIVSGDLNGDGKPELIVGLDGTQTNIVILKSTSTPGNISFAEKEDVNIGLNPIDLKIADVDGDKKADILAIVSINASINSNVYVWRNMSINGGIDISGTYQFPLEYKPMSMAIGDLDGDGKIDVATTNINGCISLLRNTSTTGTVTFAPRLDSCSVGSTRGIVVADMNGDGKADVMVSDAFYAHVSVFRNTSVPGTFSLAARKSYSAGTTNTHQPYYVAVGDLDADGKPDMVTSNLAASGSGNHVSILRNRIAESTPSVICALGSATLTSNITGTSYQWQINRGSGFVNIPDSATYTGTNTSTLQLSNLPSSWYGYQFRCMVNGNESNWFSLKFTNVWTGSANNVWENAANWSCGFVPDGNTDVIITSGNLIINSNVTVRSLTTSAGVQVIVNPGFVLTVAH